VLIGGAVFMLNGAAESVRSDRDAQMKKLAHALLGGWSIIEKDEPFPSVPKGETNPGREVWSETGGGPVMEQFHAKSSAGDQDETALFWWDAKSQKYAGMWCAPINDEGCNGFEGRWDGNDLVLEGSWLHQGKRSAWREVFKFPNSSSFVQTLYLGEPAAELKLASTISGTREPSEKKP
jgi:hypothetical protein